MSFPAESRLTSRQWVIICLVASIQFINILDFVMVMPLGPDFARALGILESDLGYVSGSYTAAASISGLIGSFIFDRFDRRKVLACAFFGLILGTGAGGFAVDLPSLLCTRIVAGAFGGPATSLSFSIIADTIPSMHRGKAMGTILGAFSAASVLGVPAGLWLAEHSSWRAPFFCIAGLGVGIGAASISLLPPMRAHLSRPLPTVSFIAFVSRSSVQLSYLMTCTIMMANFVVIPNIAAYIQLNLGFPRSSLQYVYGIGGMASFLATQIGGRLVDRFGSFKVGTVGSLLLASVVFVSLFLQWSSAAPILVILCFASFMFANALRNVAYNTLASKVPEPEVRARFQSLQSAVQHGSIATAAFLSTQLLTTAADVGLVGTRWIALMNISLTACVPVLLFIVERRVQLSRRSHS